MRRRAMRRWRLACALAWVLACVPGCIPELGGAALAAAPTVLLRSGVHPGFGRLVFDVPAGVRAEVQRQGDRLVIRFSPADVIDRSAVRPPNVLAIAVSPGRAEFWLAAGARVHRMRLGPRLVIDVFAPKPGAAMKARRAGRALRARPALEPEAAAGSGLAQPAPVAAEAAPATLVLVPDHPEGLSQPALAAPATPPVSPPVAARSLPSTAPISAVAEAALPAPGASFDPPAGGVVPPPAAEGAAKAAVPAMGLAAWKLAGTLPAMGLPFAAGTAAAAFREGGDAVLVFDRSRPIDMAALHDDPVFGEAAVQLLPGATVVRLKLAAGMVLRLARDDAGWTVTALPEAAAGRLQEIRPASAAGGLLLGAATPGAVVPVPDAGSGGLLLVGTQAAAGEALQVARRTPEFELLAGFQGVAVRPVSDRVTLRVAPGGFLIGAGPGGSLDLSPQTAAGAAQADASLLSQQFHFPDLDRAALRARLLDAVDAAAASPAQARGAARTEVARAMIALGMGPEAQSVLGLAAAEDPRLADDPRFRGLSAIAALAAGRPGEAGGIDDPALTGSDDVAFWRAVRVAMADRASPLAAAVFASDAALPLTYPAPLRAPLLPLMAETMVAGGEAPAARHLLEARPADGRLDLARGMLAEAAARAGHGGPKAALAIYDRLAAGADRRDHARAAARAVDLRVDRMGLAPGKGADALEALLYAWRGDGREIALRQRIASLRAAAGEWRRSLAMLRESAGLFPDQAKALHDQLAATFARAVAADAARPLPPLQLVALAEENADLMPDGAAGEALASRMADRLAALDLPEQAAAVLGKLMDAAPAGAAKAAFGERLARMRLEGHDPNRALAALAASAAEAMPPALVESRTLSYARAAALQGNMPSATAALAALDTPAALGLRAELLETAKDWPAAAAALRLYAGRVVPGQGALNETQARLVLRWASAAGQAGDAAALAGLRADMLARVPAGQLADMLRLLTQPPLTGVSQLPQVADEVRLARALPVALKSLTH